MRFTRIGSLASPLAILSFAVGCGGGSSSPPPPPITVVVAPATTTMQAGAGAMQQFTATVQNTGNTSVTWTLTQGGTPCSPACGTLSSSTANPVTYTTPANPPTGNLTVTIAATSVADASKSGSAFITVPAVTVSVAPTTASAIVTTTQQFTATVANDPANKGVTWRLSQGGNACSPACGTLDSANANPVTYTAPSAITASPTVTITATSAADASKAASATVTVAPPVLTIFPGSEVLGPNGARFLTARIVGLSDQSVTWSVQEGTTGGTVTSTGLYTAPAATSTYHVVATSVANSSVTATAQITVIGAGFKPIASMNKGRALHTATVLKDGRVLVTGGFPDGSSAPLASAEIYDPARGSFSSIASMAKPRSGHTATLLQDGTVLIAGGGVNNDDSAELFDPVAGTFTLAPVPMNAQRNFHTATLLSNGQVLLVGGTDNAVSSVVDTAEVYNPTTKTFTAIGTMTSRRWFHTATVLNNGKILITGGFQDINSSATSSAELFDPTSRTFKLTGNTDRPRGQHSATLLADGRVLIAGGLNRFAGGFADFTTELYSSAELYDPAAGTFQPAGFMANPRVLHTAIRLPGGKVLLSGGSGGILAGLLATAELYDPQTGSFAATGSLEMGLWQQAAVLLNDGRVLVVGGRGGSPTSVSIAEVYQ
jgi:hypothetical protein